MKIKLTEDNLEQELINKREEENKIKDTLEELFITNNFKKQNKLNGTAYTAQQEDVKANFYFDDTLSYSGYVTGENMSLTVKGFIEDIIEASNKIISQYNEIVDNIDVEVDTLHSSK